MLEVDDFTCIYPGAAAPALSGVSLAIPPGTVTAVTGPSGSGKSTLLHAVAGLVPGYVFAECGGTVTVGGENCLRAGAGGLAGKVGFLSQNPETQFLAMTVEEDILLALRCRGVAPDEAQARARRYLGATGLAGMGGSDVSTLSDGQKQRAILAGLLALRPGLLALDEPSANLDPESVADLAEQLALFKREGVSILVADHRLDWLAGLADRAVVLHRGERVWDGPFHELDAAAAERFHLRSPRPPLPDLPDVRERSFSGAETGMTVERLSFGYSRDRLLIDELSCVFPRGRVTAVTGRSGCGKTSLARLLLGLEKPLAGRILRDGREMRGRTALRDAAMVLQNADHQLYMPTARRELDLSAEAGAGSAAEDIHAFAHRFGLAGFLDRHPHSLSGGEKQRLVVAACVALGKGFVVLDEPTSGLDGGNLDIMAANVRRLAESGVTVVLISHDRELLAKAADYTLPL